MRNTSSWRRFEGRSSAEMHSSVESRGHPRTSGLVPDLLCWQDRLGGPHTDTPRCNSDAEVAVLRNVAHPTVRFEEVPVPRSGHRAVLKVNQVAFSDFARGALRLAELGTRQAVGRDAGASASPKGIMKQSPSGSPGTLHALAENGTTVDDLPAQLPFPAGVSDEHGNHRQLAPTQKPPAESHSRPCRVLSSSEQAVKAREPLRDLSAYASPPSGRRRSRPSLFKGVSKVRSHIETHTRWQTLLTVNRPPAPGPAPSNCEVSGADEGGGDTWERAGMVSSARAACSASSQVLRPPFPVQQRADSYAGHASSGRISQGSVPPQLRRLGERSSFSRSTRTCTRSRAFAGPPRPTVALRSEGSDLLPVSAYQSVGPTTDSLSPHQSNRSFSRASGIPGTISSIRQNGGRYCVSTGSSSNEVSDISPAGERRVPRARSSASSWCVDTSRHRQRKSVEEPSRDAASSEADKAPLSPEAHSLPPEAHSVPPEAHSLPPEAHSLPLETGSLPLETGSLPPETHGLPWEAQSPPSDNFISSQSLRGAPRRCPARNTTVVTEDLTQCPYPVAHHQQKGFTSGLSGSRHWGRPPRLLPRRHPSHNRTLLDTSQDQTERARRCRRPVRTGGVPTASAAASEPRSRPGLPRLSTSLSADQLPLYRDCTPTNLGQARPTNNRVAYANEQPTNLRDLGCDSGLLGRSLGGPGPRRDGAEVAIRGNECVTPLNNGSSAEARGCSRWISCALPSLPRQTTARTREQVTQLGQEDVIARTKEVFHYSRAKASPSRRTSVYSPTMGQSTDTSLGSVVFQQLNNLRQLVSEQLDRNTSSSVETIQRQIQDLSDCLQLLHLQPPSRSSRQSNSPAVNRMSSINAGAASRSAVEKSHLVAPTTVCHSGSTELRKRLQQDASFSARKEIEWTPSGTERTATTCGSGSITPSEAATALPAAVAGGLLPQGEVMLAGLGRSAACCARGPESPPGCGLPSWLRDSATGERSPLVKESRILARCVGRRLAQEGHAARSSRQQNRQDVGVRCCELLDRTAAPGCTNDSRAAPTLTGFPSEPAPQQHRGQPDISSSEPTPPFAPSGNGPWAGAGPKKEQSGTAFKQRRSGGLLKRSFTASVLASRSSYEKKDNAFAERRMFGPSRPGEISSAAAKREQGIWPVSPPEGQSSRSPMTQTKDRTVARCVLVSTEETAGSDWERNKCTDATTVLQETTVKNSKTRHCRLFATCEASSPRSRTPACALTQSAHSCCKRFGSVLRRIRFVRRRWRPWREKPNDLPKRKLAKLVEKAPAAGEQNKTEESTVTNAAPHESKVASQGSPADSPALPGSEGRVTTDRTSRSNMHGSPRVSAPCEASGAPSVVPGTQPADATAAERSEPAEAQDEAGKNGQRQPGTAFSCARSADAVCRATEGVSTLTRCTNADPAELSEESLGTQNVSQGAASEAFRAMLAEVLRLLQRQKKKLPRTTRAHVHLDHIRQTICTSPFRRKPRHRRESDDREVCGRRRLLLKRSARMKRKRAECARRLSTSEVLQGHLRPTEAMVGVTDRESDWEFDDHLRKQRAPQDSVKSGDKPSDSAEASFASGRTTALQAVQRAARSQQRRRTGPVDTTGGTRRHQRDEEDLRGRRRSRRSEKTPVLRGMPRHMAERAVLRTAREKGNQRESCGAPQAMEAARSEAGDTHHEKSSPSSFELPPGRPESGHSIECCGTRMADENEARPSSTEADRKPPEATEESTTTRRCSECQGEDADTDESPSRSPFAPYEELFGFPDLIPEEWYADRAPSLAMYDPSRNPSPLASDRGGTEFGSPSFSPTAMQEGTQWFPGKQLTDLQFRRDQLEQCRLESVGAAHSPGTPRRRGTKQMIWKEGSRRSASPDPAVPPQFPEDLLELLGTVEDLSPSALVNSGADTPVTPGSSSSDESSVSCSPTSATESEGGSKTKVGDSLMETRSSSAMMGLRSSSDSGDSSDDITKSVLEQKNRAREGDSSCPSAASSCTSITSGTQSLNEEEDEGEATSVSSTEEDHQIHVNDDFSLLGATEQASILSAVQNAADPSRWRERRRLPPRTAKRLRDTGSRRARSQPPSRAHSLPKKAGRTQQRRRQAGLRQRLLALESTCLTHRDFMKQFARRMCLPGIHKVACIEMTKAKRPLSVCTRHSEESSSRELDTGAEEEGSPPVEERLLPSAHAPSRVLTIESCVASCLRKRGWVMNKLLDTRFFDLKWKLSDVIEDYRSLRPEQLFNHFQNNRVITTKAGLARSFRLLAVEEQVRVDDFFPRCYDLSSLDDCADFLLDYSRGEAVTILLHFLRCLQATATEFREAMTQPQPETPLRHSGVLILWMAYHIVFTWLHELHPDFFLDKLEGLERRPLNPQHLEVFATHAWNFRKNPSAFQREWHALAHGCGRDRTALCRKRSKIDAAARRSFDAFKEKGISRAPAEAQILAVLREVRAGWSLWGAERGNVCLESVSSSNNGEERGTETASTQPRWLQHNIWIIKPSSNSRASGVYCLDSPWEILKSGRGLSDRLVQRYVERPLLLFDGRKFDLRQWVLIRSFNPLKVYAFTDLYLRLCTEAYDVKDLHNRFRHISNWNLNRLNSDSAQFSSAGGPVSTLASECSKPLSELKVALDQVTGIPSFWEQHVMPQIRHIILQTAKAARPFVISRPNCFELYGFDILLDEDFRPWLIEVNLSPACTARSCWHKRMVSSMSQQLLDLLLEESLPLAPAHPEAPVVFHEPDRGHAGQFSPRPPHWDLLFDETIPPSEAARRFPSIEPAVRKGFVRPNKNHNPFLQFYSCRFQRTAEQQQSSGHSYVDPVSAADECGWSRSGKKGGVKRRSRTSENGEGGGRDKLMVIGVQLSRQQEADLDFWVRIAEARSRIIRWWRQTAWRRRAARRRKMRVHTDIELDICFP